MQEIHLIGINHKTSKVSDRERFIIDDSNLIYLNDFLRLKLDKRISGFFGLSTCNRTEIYFYGDRGVENDVLELTKEALNISDIPDKNFYIYDGLKALEHMCRVCCGIDSQVVGEQEIFGQFKNAYNSAKVFKTVGKELMIYVEKVFEIAKKVRTETKIGINPLSVSGLSFNLLKEIFENPENKQVLVIGGGDLAKSIIKNLFDKGLRSISAINRTIKEIKISEDFSIIPMPLNLVHRELVNADIIICSASSLTPIIGKGAVENALKNRGNKPMMIIDLAVPRNVEPEIKDLELVYLFSIDDIEKISQDNLEERLVEAGRGKEIIKYQALKSNKTIISKIEDDKFASEILKLLKYIDDKRIYELSNHNDINLEFLTFLDNADNIQLSENLREKIELIDGQKLISIISNSK
ncbi:MAG: glutamyl-tRNA reductase [Gammaproteobacteria bacterium]